MNLNRLAHRRQYSHLLGAYLTITFVATSQTPTTAAYADTLSKKSTEAPSAIGHSSQQQALKDDNLGFSVEALVTALKFGNSPLKNLSLEVKGESFTIKMTGISIFGVRNKDSYKVVSFSVLGTGPNFSNCLERVLRLANEKHSQTADWLVGRFITDIRGDENPEVFLEKDGIRYHLQKLVGLTTFHCSNATVENNLLLRAQPG